MAKQIDNADGFGGVYSRYTHNDLLTSILQRILIKQLQTYPLKKRFFEVTDIGKQSLAS